MDLSFLGPSAAVVIVVVTFVGFLNKAASKLSDSLDSLTKSNEKIARATTKSATEAKQRNGHLAELMIESKRETIQGFQTIREQHVETQHIDTQTVQSRED